MGRYLVGFWQYPFLRWNDFNNDTVFRKDAIHKRLLSKNVKKGSNDGKENLQEIMKEFGLVQQTY